MNPTPRALWVKYGEPCAAPDGATGIVTSITLASRTAIPSVGVQWANGTTTETPITQVTKEAR